MMCSVQEGGDLMPERATQSKTGKPCSKCKQPSVIVIRADHAFCRECFVAAATHKFRSAFGKSRVVRDGEKVILGYSGGNGSTALLHLCLEGRSPRAHRKLRFSPVLVYIDEGATMGWSATERCEANTPIIENMKKSGLPCYIYALEQAMDLVSVEKNVSGMEESTADVTHDLQVQLQKLHIHNNNENKLHTLLAATKSLTTKENLIFTLRQRLLVAIARALGHFKVVVGDSSNRLSTQMLSSITQGRGAHLAQQMAFADSTFEDVMFIRPMREFLAKEVVMYNTVHSLETTVLPTISTKTVSGASLNRLTEDFVAGLQSEFPSTVSTVFRTGEKLQASQAGSVDEDVRCCLCQAHLDTNVGPSSALSATLFSQMICQKKSEQVSTNQNAADACCGDSTNQKTGDKASGSGECCGQGDGSCQSTNKSVGRADLSPLLCYGCRLIIQDMGDISTLPDVVVSEAARRTRRQQMKDSIQDFLLPEGST